MELIDEDGLAPPAHVLARRIATRRLRATALAEQTLSRIEQLEPTYHCLAVRRPVDDVLAETRQVDREIDSGHHRGWLHGLPYAVKDLTDVRGLPTGLGLWPPDQVAPAADDGDFVPRLRAAGAVIVGKTATPELGLGSHTFTDVGPTTRNAIDPDRSAGGSSGGAAVAVATGLLAVADGSDFMGSLRNPPGWNGVLGLRPTGPDPRPARTDVRGDGGAFGAIARDAVDLTLLHEAINGDSRGARRPLPRLRIGWLADLDGSLATEPGLLDACAQGLEVLRRLGHVVSEPGASGLGLVEPDLWSTWLTFRFAAVGRELLEFATAHDCRDRLKPEARWEIAGWQQTTPAELEAMASARAHLARSLEPAFHTWDLLALPTAQVFPFPHGLRWPNQIAGRRMDTYHRWMEVTTLATLAGVPALAVPVPTEGPPIGLQLIGPRHSEPLLLALAAEWQGATAGHPGIRLARSLP